MKASHAIALLAALTFTVGANGQSKPYGSGAAEYSRAVPSRQPLYYRHPGGEADFSAGPKTTPDGRDYLPVYEGGETPQATSQSATPISPARGGRVLYYRNPMGLPDTSPVPKKDAMGMDYVPVFEDDVAGPAGTVNITPERVQMLGVRTEVVAERRLERAIRAVGTIAMDERRLAVVAPRFEGWIERLLVSAIGDTVHRGQPLFEVYSPDLALAEHEYLIARRAAPNLAEAALSRLRNLGLPAEQITRLRDMGVPGSTLTLPAPIDGVVVEKSAVQGQRFAPGDMLYRIADLSQVWLLADVFEQDLAQIHLGEAVTARLTAYPGRDFTGTVSFIYPTVNATTRAARVRIIMANPDLALKPDMYATVDIAAPLTTALAVPESAVLDSGTRQVVLVERGKGRFEPRAVAVGRRAAGYLEIRDGLRPGERVVTGANFLIDAESNLRAALQSFGAPGSADTPPATPGGAGAHRH